MVEKLLGKVSDIVYHTIAPLRRPGATARAVHRHQARQPSRHPAHDGRPSPARAWLGHVSLNTTNVYAEVDLAMKPRR